MPLVELQQRFYILSRPPLPKVLHKSLAELPTAKQGVRLSWRQIWERFQRTADQKVPRSKHLYAIIGVRQSSQRSGIQAGLNLREYCRELLEV
jgi:hypothetical protein